MSISEQTSSLRCWAEIDISALRANVRRARLLASPAGLLAIVKADAYGHGAAIVVPAIEDEVAMFGVATLDEARALSTRRPILLLSPCLSAERADALREGFIPSVSTYEELDAYAAAAKSLTRPAPVHLVVDTGMGRIGFPPDKLAAALQRISVLPSLRMAGLATHLPSADEDMVFTSDQLASFESLLGSVSELLPAGVVVHCLNSAGLMRFSRHAHALVRTGLMLYGVAPVPEGADALRPVMCVRARVTLVRDLPAGHGVSYGRTYVTTRPTRIATLAIGYADGYPRALSGRNARVLLGGRSCSVIGRVTMDQIMVDVSNSPQVAPGDVATVLGHDPHGEIPASELATLAGTIPWEILTGIQQRVIRVPRSQPEDKAVY